jgi:hypothetical protein
MKKVLSIFFASLCAFTSYSQSRASYHYAEVFYFIKEVPTDHLGGVNFRYEIAVKANPLDTFSKVRVHCVGLDKANGELPNGNFNIETRQEQDWTIYTVIGKIDRDAQKLCFYASVNGNGNFYFDDISFYLETRPGNWRQVSLYNSSFEEEDPDIFAGYSISRTKNNRVQTLISKDVVKSGRRALLVKTKGVTPAAAISSVMK